MEGDIVSQRVHAFLLVLVLALLVVGGAAPAQARPVPPSPTVALGSVARLAPDGRSVEIDVAASCPEWWTVVGAVVSVSQGQASGEAPFPLTCTGGVKLLTVAVESGAAPFQLGQANATASVRIQRGRTAQAQDSKVVRAVPTPVVQLADTAVLADGGGALFVDVTVACPWARARSSHTSRSRRARPQAKARSCRRAMAGSTPSTSECRRPEGSSKQEARRQTPSWSLRRRRSLLRRRQPVSPDLVTRQGFGHRVHTASVAFGPPE
jgi:hypothetical protein